jgi:SAM-dependent methyltransferase
MGFILNERNFEKAALRGEPSYVWREGQQRRLQMVLESAGERINGRLLENGCGVGMYIEKLKKHAGTVIGLEFDFERTLAARQISAHILNAAGEYLPFPDGSFDLILSHEVIEHVQDDTTAVAEMIRVLKPGGRAVIFSPNRGYPFETHGVYWKGTYRFGNIPFVNWLPRRWRDHLAPHVEIYTSRDMEDLFADLPVRYITRTVIFGAYDNIINRFGSLGRVLRTILQFMERTPLRFFGLSHLWVVEKEYIRSDFQATKIESEQSHSSSLITDKSP